MLRSRHLLALLVVLTAAAAVAQTDRDAFQKEALGAPEKAKPDILIVGSGSTVFPIVQRWLDPFAATHPGVTIEVEGEGTAWGPPALVSGRAQIAAMSRPMTRGETDSFVERAGTEPLALPIAYDAVAIYVHASNPLEHLTLIQIDRVFSLGRRCGRGAAARTWGDLGVTGSLASRPIEVFGQGRDSGTGGYFQERALCGGILIKELHTLPGGGRIAAAIAEAPAGIGFETWATHPTGVKALAVGTGDDSVFTKPDATNLRSGTYPLARTLYLYAKGPAAGLDPKVRAFLEFAVSDEGQAIVEQAGYVHLSPAAAQESRAQLR